MILTFAIAASMSSSSARSTFRVNYELQSLTLDNSAETPVYVPSTLRYESDAAGTVTRMVIKSAGSARILTFTTRALTLESVAPDGSKQSQTVPLPSLKSAADYFKFFSPGEEISGFKIDGTKATKESKIIAGVRCQRAVITMEANDNTVEIVNWNPVDKRYAGWRLPPLETYTYAMDGDTRKLSSAMIVTGVKFGKSKPNAKMKLGL